MSLSLDAARKVATITLSGPADVWFGVGWNAKTMTDQPYAIIVEGKSGNVTERRLGDHDPGRLLQPTQVRGCVRAGLCGCAGGGGGPRSLSTRMYSY